MYALHWQACKYMITYSCNQVPYIDYMNDLCNQIAYIDYSNISFSDNIRFPLEIPSRTSRTVIFCNDSCIYLMSHLDWDGKDAASNQINCTKAHKAHLKS